MNGLLLDTHIWLWVAEGITGRVRSPVLAAIEQARVDHSLYVSATSVWEIGLLCAKDKIRLSAPVREWITRAIARPGMALLPLDAETALESTRLPGAPHGDPADRFLIAAAN
ncbi:MAG: type II toxin-antitoxin system VapC family toxin [Porticoccaceae bacterium]